ncbi:MAG: hypothetical protein R3B45_00275 [Bdellovibrionota bacterium]
MKKLSSKNFDKARKFLFANGRPLDVALFKFHFEDGSPSAVMNELAKYQNEDGGFGNSLEPDLRTPLSSALATSIALREMVNLNVDRENEILSKTITYLLTSLDRQHWRWVIAPEGRKDSPHAPWWGADDILSAFSGCVANPSSEITGLLLNYRGLIPEEILSALLKRMQAYLLETIAADGGSFEMHDLMCYLVFFHSENLDQLTREEIRPILISQAERIVDKDRNKWSGYGARPLSLCDNPNSMLYPYLKECVNENLDFEIENQSEEGSWMPFWNWGDYNTMHWPMACREWSSHLTFKTLLILKNFDRLERI